MKPAAQRSRADVVAAARGLAGENGASGRLSLRRIAADLAKRGMLAPSGKPYLPGSVAIMIGPASRRTRV
jgi:hypothetical protein